MKTIYLDIFSGISGDMFIGAMLDLGVDFKQFETELQKLKLDDDYHLHAARGQKANIEGVKFDVHLEDDHHHHHHDEEEEHSHAHQHAAHAHQHEHSHGHHHHSHGDDDDHDHDHDDHDH